MKQIILTMPDALISEIQWASCEDGRPEAEGVREALRAYLGPRRIGRLDASTDFSNRSFDVRHGDQYLADLAEPYR
jgi:hypothetical protein